MPENREKGAGNHIITGYMRPFTSKGFIPFIISFVLAIVPIVQILVPAIAFSNAPTIRNGGLGSLIKLSLKMFFVTVILLAPSMALYLLIYILGERLQIGPDWLLYIPVGFMLLFIISAMIRLPMALVALARGCSIREATDGRFIKLLISANFSRYVVFLLCFMPIAFLTLFMDLMPLWLSIVFGAFLTAYVFSYLGYVINRCYDRAAPSLGLPTGPPPPTDVGGSRYVRPVISMLLVVSLLAQFCSALAFNEDEEMASGNYPKNQYTAEEYNAAYEKFYRNGQLNRYTVMHYDTDTGRFYCTKKITSTENGAAILAGFVVDCTPLGGVKDLYEAYQYKKIADDPSRSDAERAAAKKMQYLKFAGAALSFAVPAGKVASKVVGKGVIPYLIVKAGTAVNEDAVKAIIYISNASLWGWDRIRDIAKLSGGGTQEALDPYTMEAAAGVETPYQWTDPVPPGNAEPASAEPEGPVATIPEGKYEPFWGTYRGTLVCPYNNMEAFGVTGSFSSPDLTITLDEDGYMSLSYTFDSNFNYDSDYGISVSGEASLPVNIRDVFLTRTLAGYMGDYSSTDFTATTVTRYSGEGYENGGGEITTTGGYKISFSVIFSMETVGGKLQTVADGSVTQTPLTGNETETPLMVMSFRITKAG